jgi:hypothetical protein
MDFGQSFGRCAGLLGNKPQLRQEIHRQRSHQRIVFDHEDFRHGKNSNIRSLRLTSMARLDAVAMGEASGVLGS